MRTDQTTGSSFRLVVGNDFTEAGGFAFDQAVTVARRVRGSELHVVHVATAQTSAHDAKRTFEELRLYVEAKSKALGIPDEQSIAVHIRYGHPARELAQFARDAGADLIVVGTAKGPHLKQLFVGSVAERLLAAAPCPVFVAGPFPSPKDEAHEPMIEPPCTDCVAARRASSGKTWWCPRHAAHHAAAHVYSYHREIPMRTHDSSVTPTGVDLP